MPMSKNEKLEKVQRLHTAHRKTKEFLENEPPTWELHPGTDIARNWTVITAAYSGLEQTIKYLVAEEKGPAHRRAARGAKENEAGSRTTRTTWRSCSRSSRSRRKTKSASSTLDSSRCTPTSPSRRPTRS